jgi:predicted ferric reductase
MKESPGSKKQFSEMSAAAHRVLLSAGFVLLLLGVFSIPFYYETTTLWYKFGLDKTLLKSGQFIGLAALMLIFLQIVLSVRGSYLEGVFGAADLLRYHQTNGVFIAVLACSHALLILVPEGIDNLPIGKKYWPEMVGAALLLLIVVTAFVSVFRTALRLNYLMWRMFHRALGYMILLLAVIHVLFVSESFEHLLPRVLALGLTAGLTIWVLVNKWPGYRAQTFKQDQSQGENP